ncbi:glycoside hydrolase family 27 protein [Pontibacter sp. G13]|uniref:glycoside hydrolase family 27 protein n=1 Tax=Pontibacter sp. G13 TaxID=3074898 RepID=UPI00288A217C|nr:glycoside hydrolase family 27 protein [Pontibacter sp. G13]WNJ19142.1 glycoside hydrolase family 27 protein [Pontibacter sp. G13]
MQNIILTLTVGLSVLFLHGCGPSAAAESPESHSLKTRNTPSETPLGDEPRPLAPRPPMGWNSYNCYGAAVQESEVKANADYMADKLKSFGWEYIVVDYCWSYPHPPGSVQNNPPQFRLKKDQAPVPWLAMDEYGRLLPDPRKFPSAQNGAGFKPLADYVHELGLKFGVHVMRGIPRQAVWAKSPIKGAPGLTAADIADTTSLCPWLNQMYGIDMSKPGAQAYLNSLIDLYAEWGVDYVKLDDIDLKDDYPYRGTEVEGFSRAFDQNDRPMVLSLSLNMKYENREHVQKHSQLWRISKDFWDEWHLLKNQFSLTSEWAKISGPDSWPDADMLQLGWISRRGPHGPERESRFTEDEQITHMTLWCIAQSPLMMGGDMPDNSPLVEQLLTNEEVLAANQQAYESREASRVNGQVVWTSKIPNSDDRYVAVFNLNDDPQDISFSFADLGLPESCKVRDLWKRKDVGTHAGTYSHLVNPHGAQIFRVSPM